MPSSIWLINDNLEATTLSPRVIPTQAQQTFNPVQEGHRFRRPSHSSYQRGCQETFLDPWPEAVGSSRGIQPLCTLAELFVLTRFWSAAVKAADRGGSRYPCGFIAALWTVHHSSIPKLTSVNGLRKLATMVLSETRGL